MAIMRKFYPKGSLRDAIYGVRNMLSCFDAFSSCWSTVSSTRTRVEEVWCTTEVAAAWCSGCDKVWTSNIGGL